MRQPSARNVRRAQEFQALKHVQQRQLPLVHRVLRTDRRKIRDYVWTCWMRSRMSPKRDARLKLHDLLWRAWTTPQFGSSSTRDLSHRDVYRRERFREARAQMDVMIASAIQAQKEILLTCLEPDRPPAPTRGVSEAGSITPPSRKARGKQSRGRGGRGA